jgi:hypothetical protein
MAAKTVRVGDITQGAVQTIEAAWRAVAELEARFNALLAAMDGDSGVNLTTYAATYGTDAVTTERAIVD